MNPICGASRAALLEYPGAADRVHPYPRHVSRDIVQCASAADRDDPYPRHVSRDSALICALCHG